MNMFGLLATTKLGEATSGGGFWMPENASATASAVDDVFYFINNINYFFFALVIVILIVFAIKYHVKPSAHVNFASDAPTHNTPLELTWTAIPLLIVGVLFWLGMDGYLHLADPPDDSYPVSVTAQKWSWTFEHPEYGVTESAELTVPLGRPVRLLMTSPDVLHSLYVPAFRVKQDVVPGRYTSLWFEATKPGQYRLYCTEYCGKDHSKMLAVVNVLPEDEFQKHLGKLAREYEDIADKDLPVYALTRLYNRCASCHSLDGKSGTGPSFKGLWDRTKNGTTVFTDGSTLKDKMGPGGEFEVPENYLRDSILNPQHYIVQNYAGTMPTFKGQLKQRQIDALVLMLKNHDKLVDAQGNPIEAPNLDDADISMGAGK
ncbi:MAG: cytochrome c oxidase subunit II [Phycisphaerales bacterium]|jgi:cytochrome c oxidase subunit 2|nr:cytochrome c oxidase subunit II [Phycisphaerales bacterium]MDP6310793.1 cytochrome c oxidase subunit II [Phycisphaerales bacterium]MDP7086497.1 cytochrome c oxidase subunit II [Phycisphaerales bacterium]MDP7189158.1 cytochrome c oxidase subunit II [Phycisphaerales bacterium]MDP7519491.1 cytochrome c oxidase subunit II [Phycisphaerales bacterium]|tara:strand:- start:1474 stop:2595 length:1122 start_codon:yes stop_codon:yes gene_type:complete